MSGYVLDASVAAKFVLDTEPHFQQAQALLQAHRAGELTFLAPDFFCLRRRMFFGKLFAVREFPGAARKKP